MAIEKWQMRNGKSFFSSRATAFLLNVFPVPRLGAVRAEAKPFGVTHQPLVNAGLHLQGAVCISRINRFATNVKVERAAGEMGPLNGEPGASPVSRPSQ